MNIFLGNPPENIKQWIIEHYTPPTPVAGPLCFEAVGSDITVQYGNNYGFAGGMQQAGINFQYSTDGKNWTEWVLGETQFDPISIPVGTKLYLRGNNPNGVYSPNGPASEHFTFTGSGTINASGNIQSLIDPTMERTDVPDNCYSNMFSDCISLTQAPELPATTLASGCYSSMFRNCTYLTSAPELPATDLDFQCYTDMFNGCTSLSRIKMNASSGSWGENMFNGCTSLELVDMTGSTGVPTLENVNNFDNTNDTYKIVVPDSLYDTWVNETNWASIATHIMKQSDWNNEHPDDILGQQ